MNLTVLYRGPLSSCNYGCSYCPFAKRRETAAQRERDRAALSRFCDWLSLQTQHRWQVLFTPWGEALVRKCYRKAVVELSHWPHVERVAVQTNLSGSLAWLARVEPSKVGLWTTFHPSEVTLDSFLSQVAIVRQRGISLSVGLVGTPAHLELLEDLRCRLPDDVYLWVNALQGRRRRYDAEEIARVLAVDPLFLNNLRPQSTLGLPCRTGETAFTVDGEGTMRRCHFVDTPLGSIHDPHWERFLQARPCPRRRCDCHLGHMHLPHLDLPAVFGEGWLERALSPNIDEGTVPFTEDHAVWQIT
jgi:sulfatase maturation enzyme AslB (radical SAM superfamily)